MTFQKSSILRISYLYRVRDRIWVAVRVRTRVTVRIRVMVRESVRVGKEAKKLKIRHIFLAYELVISVPEISLIYGIFLTQFI